MDKEIYNERLLQFATHLNAIKPFTKHIQKTAELVEVDMKVRIHYKLVYNFLIINELPKVFSEWFYHEGGWPLLNGTQLEQGPITGISKWFKLNPEEICQILDIEECQVVHKYGVKILNQESTPKDHAFNIEKLVEYRKIKQ